MSIDISFDLETLGTTPGSAILSIGACEFDTNTGQIGRTFYRTINLGTSMQAGFTADASTIMWWFQQSDEARTAVRMNTYPVREALQHFADWLPKDARMWARGPSFDSALLAKAYNKLNMPQPWFYANDRCHRTITARNPSIEPPPEEGVHHNALDDAIYQAKWLIKIAEAHRAKASS
jgi:3' exoribonuclease, RNase T-like